MKVALVDFGATSVKSVLVDLDNPTVIVDQITVPSPSQSNVSDLPGHYEVPVLAYKFAFQNTAGELIQRYGAQAVYICSEMHGFAVAETGLNPTVYISWKDSRASTDKLDANKFLQITGMQLRSGLPYVTLPALDIDPTVQYRLYTLVDCILDVVNYTNITLAAATGFVDTHNNVWSSELLPPNITGNAISTDLTDVIGYVNDVPVYAGIGDLQSALTGAELGIATDAVFNLGTGSQVAVTAVNGNEYRPMPGGHRTAVKTHIPSGRALNVIAEFVDSVSQLANGTDVFWELWQAMTAERILVASMAMSVDLNVFESAWRYTNSKTIKLREGSNTVVDLVAGTAYAWASQYVSALRLMDPETKIKSVTVTGGVAHRSPWLIELFGQLDTDRQYTLCSTVTGEETLDGLLKIALNIT